MTYASVAQDLHTHFLSEVATPNGIVTAGDNMPFANPDGGFATVWVSWDQETIMGVGVNGTRFRIYGTLIIMLHTPLARGDAAARQWAAATVAAFSGAVVGEAEIGDVVPLVMGVMGAWWVMQVAVPFSFFHLETRPIPTGGRHTVDTAASTVRQRFMDLVATPLQVPVRMDNEPDIEDLGKLWSRLYVKCGVVDEELGGGVATVTGGAAAILLAPLGSGTSAVLAVADALTSAFRARQVNGIQYGSPSLTRAGRVGRWWQINVICPFTYEQL